MLSAVGWPAIFTELIVWQLADEIRVHVLSLTRKPAFSVDYKLRAQLEDAINSACRNIAEGFGCDTHREFVRFLVISRRSLNEVQDALRSAQLKAYITAGELSPILVLFRRVYRALSRFIASLREPGNDPRRGRREGKLEPQPPRADQPKDDHTIGRDSNRQRPRTNHRTPRTENDPH